MTFVRRRHNFLLTNDYKKTLIYTLKVLHDFEIKAANNRDFQTLIISLFQASDNVYFDVYCFIRKNISYKDDDKDETIISPLKILGLKYGDCDDMALFTKSILTVLGIESNFLLLGRRPGEFTHIVVYSNGYVIDATNDLFNNIPDYYKFQKLIKEF